ncbi:MAG: hypothetical protein ABIR33_12565 [Pyrinomonadaceae bacterium]
MKEAFFILAIVLVLFGLTAYRYRRQLSVGLQIWRMMKGARQMQSQQRSQVDTQTADRGELVNCSRCGRWAPLSTAIKFGPTIFYCSTQCLQNKVKS